MINYKQLVSMLALQNTMNKTVHPQWEAMDWDWYRASMLEGSEAMEHNGWKWWKAQRKDTPQLQMELVDIWHFYLSQFLKHTQAKEDEAALSIEQHYNEYVNKPISFDNKDYDLNSMGFLEKLDLLIGLSAAKRLHVPLLLNLVENSGMNWEELFSQYVKKNILNIFRQKNGYKEGRYHKEWFDQEDNLFLIAEAEKLDSSKENYVDNLWDSLTRVYKEALVAAGK